MTNYYDIWDNEKNKDKNDIWASGYQPQDISTNVGSGGNLAGQFVYKILSEQPWPVSPFGNDLQDMAIKIDGYGNSKVHVLDAPEQSPAEEQVLTTKEKLEQVRDIFGLSVSHLAKVLTASRPSLHSWLEGAEPRDQSIKRIEQMYNIALEWKHKSIFHYSPGRLMRQPLGDGPSMMERLERENYIDTEIKDGLDKLLQLMKRQREQMDRSIQRSKKSNLPENEKERTRHNLTETVYSK